MDAAEAQERLRVEVELGGERCEHREDLLTVVGLIAGLYRGVCREHEAVAAALERGSQVIDLPLRKVGDCRRGGHARQGGMALVEVEEGGPDRHRFERTDRANPEKRVLRETDRPVAFVQTGADPALQRGVLRDVGVEEVERHTTDVGPPDVSGDVTIPDRDLDRQRRTVGGAHARRGQRLGIGLDPVLVLPSCPVDALVEVTPAIEEPDADHWQRLIRRLLQEVAGEHSESSRIHRQGLVHAELGTQEGDRPFTEVRTSRASQIVVEHMGYRVDAG